MVARGAEAVQLPSAASSRSDPDRAEVRFGDYSLTWSASGLSIALIGNVSARWESRGRRSPQLRESACRTWMSGGPASKQSCTALFRVTGLGSLDFSSTFNLCKTA